MVVIHRWIFAVLAAVVAVASCTSGTGLEEAWCSGYADLAVAGAAFDAAAGGSPEGVAAADMEAAGAALVQLEVPDEIAADVETLRRGPDVADAGESFSAAARRISEWALDNCDYAPGIVEFLES